MTKSPGKSHRTGIRLMQLADMFPDEDTARLWFEGRVWPHCRHCGSVETYAARHPKSPYRCKDCRHYFSVKTGTALENSRIPLRKWAFAIYLETTHVKGIASMKLHRDIGVTQKTAWFMLHRIRQAWSEVANSLDGTIEADEAYIGGLEKNKHKAKKLNAGRGGVGKAKAVALRERETNKIVAKVVDRKTLQGLVTETLQGLVRRYGLSSILHSLAEIQAAPDRDAGPQRRNAARKPRHHHLQPCHAARQSRPHLPLMATPIKMQARAFDLLEIDPGKHVAMSVTG